MWRDECARLDIPDLRAELRDLLLQIPTGSVSTYGDVADALGDRSAARWVGEALLDHPHDSSCLCHRVVLRTGEFGRYISGDPHDKRDRLRGEGVPSIGERADLQNCRFTGFQSSQPLRRLLGLQSAVADAVRQKSYPNAPPEVAGVDVSYGPREAVAVYAVVDTATGRLVRSSAVRLPARFPYIPGYLSYRELPLLLELLSTVAENETPADVILVDGNGILHPRRAGIAANFGTITGLRTIGVGKKLLCGRVDLDGLAPGDAAPIEYHDDVLGAAIVNTAESRPIFVSPGNRIDVAGAVRIARSCFFAHRLPEPLYWADRLSREAARQ